MKTKTKIINLIGGPGVGKSTVASGLFHQLKLKRISCELIVEYAKEITWENNQELLENQIHVFAEQFRRQWRLIDKVDYVVTDSPLVLNSVYFEYYLTKYRDSVKFSDDYIELSKTFFDNSFLQFNNKNFFLHREIEYEEQGRNQPISEAVELDEKILTKLMNLDQEFQIFHGDTKELVEAILPYI